MLSALEYEAIGACLIEIGARPIISLENYLASHHLPNWYPLIPDMTPETHIFPADCDLETELRRLTWPEFFIKDYVKSLKTSIGSRIAKPEQVSAVVAEMRRFRGLIEGGVCVRRVEHFPPATERRYFVMHGVVHAPSGTPPAIALECARRLEGRLFYSMDVAKQVDGRFRIVEVGDGQVSDLVGWTPERFVNILHQHFGSLS